MSPGFRPSFFDVNQSGEIVSRLTADTTQIKSAVGATASVALRNTILCLGAIGMMVYTSPKLSSLVLAAIPRHRLSARRLRPLGAPAVARGAGHARHGLGLCRRSHLRFPHRPGLQRRGSGTGTLWQRRRKCLSRQRAPPSRPARILTAFAITMIFGSVVAVLWFGAQDVLSGTLSAGTLGQFLLYSVFAAG